MYKIPCVGENHGKNELLSTDFLVRHIRQSFASQSGELWVNWVKLMTKWLRNLPSDNSIQCFPRFSIRFLMFHLLFSQFLGVFPMFSLFLSVPYFRSYGSNIRFTDWISISRSNIQSADQISLTSWVFWYWDIEIFWYCDGNSIIRSADQIFDLRFEFNLVIAIHLATIFHSAVPVRQNRLFLSMHIFTTYFGR